MFFVWTWRPGKVTVTDAQAMAQGDQAVEGQKYGLFPPVGMEAPTAIPAVREAVNDNGRVILDDVAATPTPVPVLPGNAGLGVDDPQPTQAIIELKLFSFYDPIIGRDKPEIKHVNCADWSDEKNDCLSMLRNGEDWRTNYFISAACPEYQFLAKAKFRVISPDWLKELVKEFECKDTGEQVTGYYIDFLIPWRSMPFDYDKIPWGMPIMLERIG